MSEVILTGGGRTEVARLGNTVLRKTGDWATSVHAFLRHLEAEGFTGAPRVVGTGFDDSGREVLTYIEGDVDHYAPWSDEAIVGVGTLLRSLHDTASSFIPPANAKWQPWSGRDLRYSHMTIGHCDFAPWNLVAHDGIPFAAIDWETAGPVDALVELAQVCWLNVQLVDDDVAERVGLGSLEYRAHQLRLLVDAYGLPHADRKQLIEAMINVAVLDAADQAIEAKVTPDTQDIKPLWGLAWRTRSAAWIIRHRRTLEEAIA